MQSQTPLEGLRVLEYGSFISAPYAAKLMADLGAEVIKIEPPMGGDRSRRYGPFPNDTPNAEASGLFLHINGNKLGVTLDVSTLTGSRLFKALVKNADALIENAEPGYMERVGLGYGELRQANPRLVVTSLRPFGLTGRYKDLRGCDLTTWHGASAGHGFLGDPDREPLLGAWHFASHFAAHNAAAATMMALHARRETGAGQLIDVAETEALALLVAAEPRVSVFHHSGLTLKRDGQFHPGGAPSALLPCKDGFVFIHAYDGPMWDGLVKAMGSPEWAREPMFARSYQERGQYQRELYDLMSPWLVEHTKRQIFEACQANGTPAAPLYDMKEVLSEPHFRQRGFWMTQDHPVAGPMTMPGLPYRFSASLDTPRRRAPFLGEHNEGVYCGRLGLSHVELARLGQAGVI